MKDTRRTNLGGAVQPHVAAHPGQSGFHALVDAREALAARLALADAAQSSLDVQYYIWHDQPTGRVVLERLLRAADRGVRVRLLLDDIGTMPSDSVLLAIDSHPNVEVRMFNPVALRSPRWLGIITEFGRINRRMHNKSFTVDGQVSVVGGRNIGDEYFDAGNEMNFVDLDLAVIGPVVGEVSDEFDLYWNNKSSIPITALSRKKVKAGQLATMRQTLLADEAKTEHSAYTESVHHSDFARHVRNRSVPWLWGRATIVNDHPDKVATPADQVETHLTPKLRELVDATDRELFLVSPYFVPGKAGVELLSAVRQRGARVVVITNSLASTDGPPVHSKYRKYRKPLLEAGIELYETKPDPGNAPGERPRGFRGPAGSGSAGLHAKTFAFDRRIGYVGSYNIDPRSNRLNTEMGVIFDCPSLARRLPERLDRDVAQNAYRLALDRNRLVWLTHENGKEIRYYREPETSLWQRIKVRVMGWLPIESLL